MRVRRRDQQRRLAALGTAGHGEPVAFHARVRAQEVEGPPEVLDRDVAQGRREPGQPVVGEGQYGVPVRGQQRGVVLVQAAFGSAQHQHAGQPAARLGVVQHADEPAVADLGARESVRDPQAFDRGGGDLDAVDLGGECQRVRGQDVDRCARVGLVQRFHRPDQPHRVGAGVTAGDGRVLVQVQPAAGVRRVARGRGPPPAALVAMGGPHGHVPVRWQAAQPDAQFGVEARARGRYGDVGGHAVTV